MISASDVSIDLSAVPLGTDGLPLYRFDAEAADDACLFFEAYMRHTIGQFDGKPFILAPWQRDLIIRPMFGWKRTADGFRRFRTLFLEVGKKNGKTQLMSGLAMLLAFADNEPGAQVYVAAASDDQARMLWNESSKSARACPEFLKDWGVEVFKSSIVQPKTESMFKVISSTVGTKHGFNVHGLIMDEFHTQRTRDLYDTLHKGTSARRQPMTVLITTAGDDRESICYETYEYAKKVRGFANGVLTVEQGGVDDPAFLPVIFEMSPDDDWTDEANWHKANPLLGVAKTLDYMRRECAAAKAEPRKRNSFLRLELNVWTESRTVWISPEAIAACGLKSGETMSDLDTLQCTGGMDLSSSVDLTCVAVAFKRPDPRPAEEIEFAGVPTAAAPKPPPIRMVLDYSVDIVPTFFMPREVMKERIQKDRVPYDLWARDGWLRITEGSVVDYGEVYRVVLEEIAAKHKGLGEIGYDPYNAAHLVGNLQAALGPDKMVEVRQGVQTLSGPSKLLEALVASRRIRFDGNPVMKWCFANAEILVDRNDNIRPVKPGNESRGTRRIDGVVATVIALSRLMVAPDNSSVYETRGILVL